MLGGTVIVLVTFTLNVWLCDEQESIFKSGMLKSFTVIVRFEKSRTQPLSDKKSDPRRIVSQTFLATITEQLNFVLKCGGRYMSTESFPVMSKREPFAPTKLV